MRFLIAAVLLLTPAAASPYDGIMNNWKSVAKNCFRMGYMLGDMQARPEHWAPGAYDRTFERSKKVCFSDLPKGWQP